MTIALGILAVDGIVLAADSEISTDGDLKTVDTKLVGAAQQQYGNAVSVAGSGSVGYFQSLRVKVALVALQNMCREPFCDSNVEQGIQEFMLDFHAKHVVPYAGKKNAPGVDVLVAALMPGKEMLFASEKAAVRQSVHFDAIGAGGPYAISILANCYCAMSIESATLMACYVMQRVKMTIMGCGHDTQLMILREGVPKPLPLPRALVQDLEHKFENYSHFQVNALRTVVGAELDTINAKNFLDALRQDCDTARQAIKAITSPISQT